MAVALAVTSGVLEGQEASRTSAWHLTPMRALAAVRDERVSPLEYRGSEWGLSLGYTSSLTGKGWHVEAEFLRGTLDHGDRSPREVSTSFGLRGGRAWPVESGSAVRLGVEGSLVGGVRVHRFDEVDAGYAEALLGVGPTFEYVRPVGRGALSALLSASAVTLMARPYADVGVARDGDLIVRVRVLPEVFVGRAGLRYTAPRRGRFGWGVGYDLGAQRIRDADHFGRLSHRLVVTVSWRKGS